jgi:hypothetical protein
MMNLAEAAKWLSTDLPDEIEERNKEALRKACDLVRGARTNSLTWKCGPEG